MGVRGGVLEVWKTSDEVFQATVVNPSGFP